MANKTNGDGAARREPPLAAAARRLAEQRAQEAEVPPGQRPRRPQTPPQPTQPVAPQAPATPGWPADAWTRPQPEPPQASQTPLPTGDAGYSTYPPPPAPGRYPPPPPYYAAPSQGPYSPWWKRVLAALIDGVVIYVPVGILMAVTGAKTFETDLFTGEPHFRPNGAYWAVVLITLIGSFLYYTLMEGGPSGATVGKLALRIQVRDESGEGPIGYGKALGRRLMASLFWWLLIIPGLLDVLSPLWDDRRQTWHDKVVGSVVVDKG